MKIKFFLKNLIAASIILVGISFSTVSALAQEWNVGGNPNGNVGFCVGSSGSCGGNGGGQEGFMLNNQFGLPSGSILGIATNLLFWLLAIFAIMGVIGFVISGIMYLLAGADESLAEKGKAGMTASIIGIIVGLSGFLIMQAVNMLLSGNSKTF